MSLPSKETKKTLNSVTSIETFEKEHSLSFHSILLFWTQWHEPSKQLIPVMEELSKEHKKIDFYEINAEDYSDITEMYNVNAVPTIILCEKQKEKQRLEAVTAPTLVSTVNQFSKQALTQQQIMETQNQLKSELNKNEKNRTINTNENENKTNENDKNMNVNIKTNTNVENEEKELNERLKKLIKASPIMLFMKGTPQQPKCKFSRELLEILSKQNVGKFGYFDILTDENVRQGLKKLSNWPTYPQLYINGKLIGGLDVVKELIEENEFQSLLPKNESENDLNERIKKLINSKSIMLFMKGTPTNPQCGFSSEMVDLLEQENVKDFGSFNILEDNSIREGIKKYSNWPTFPQLYVNGKLIGGLDIVKELINDGEFQNEIKNT